MSDFVNYCKNRIKYGIFRFIFYLIIASIIFFVLDQKGVFADELEPTNVIQYYEYYANNEFKEASFNSEDTINLGNSTTTNYPYAISLILYGNFKKDYTYTISTNIETQFNTEYFKFYYENLDYLIMYGELTANNEKITCNLNPISQNHAYSMFCSFKAEEDINQINLSLINKDWQNNGYVPFGSDDYVKFTNYNIEEYDNSSEIITNQNQTIIDQNNQTNDKLDGIQDSITESNKETQEVIKDQFNDCRDSYNLITSTSFTTGSLYSYYELEENMSYILSIKLKDGGTKQSYYIGFKEDISTTQGNYKWLLRDGAYSTATTGSDGFYYINNSINEVYMKYLIIYPKDDTTVESLFTNYDIQLVKGSTYIEYEEPGEICTNKLDEQNKTSKGIWETIKNLPNMFLDMLKSLFIPDDGYFEEWFNNLQSFFEEKLGFLAVPLTLFIEFVERYLELDPSNSIIIKIPDITVPNFEDYKIISATTLNWSELLKSKESLNTLWELYLSFIDVFLILNFINLCENKYNRIFGGDTTQYEYYTVEDSYTINDKTGEATNHRLNQRTTTRKKVK